MDKEFLKYTAHKILYDKEKPYKMSNKRVADVILPYIRKTVPNAQLIELGETQWIIVSQNARNEAKRWLEGIIAGHNRSIKELHAVIAELDRQDE